MNSKITILLLVLLGSFAHAHGVELPSAASCGTELIPSEATISVADAAYFLLMLIAGIVVSIYGYKLYNDRKWKTDIIAFGLILALSSVLTYYFLTPGFNPTTAFFGNLGSQHIHADIRIFLDNRLLNLSKDQYMSNDTYLRSSFTHLHDGNGNVVHVHATGVTLGYFIQTLDMQLTSTCFTLDTGQSYCSNSGKSILVYVNGTKINNPQAYVFQDLDKILIYYGDPSKASEQLQLITKESCIYSKKCPIPPGFPSEETDCSVG